MSFKAKAILVSVITLLFLVILLQNTQVVTLKLLFWDLSMSQVILIPIVMVLGFILGVLAARLWAMRNRVRDDEF